MRTVLALGVAAGLFGAARRWLRVVVVDGSSMAPTYRDGDRVLALYAVRPRWVRRGDVVIARAPDATWTADRPIDEAQVTVVKRVTAIGGDPLPVGSGVLSVGQVWVQGDADGGYDSRSFGPLPASAVTGRVLLGPIWRA